MRTLLALGLECTRKRWCFGVVLSAALTLLAAISGSVARAQAVITSLGPSTVTAGGAGFTLTVNGTGFAAGFVVEVNGAARATTFVSATKLTAGILAADIATPGTDQITVSNPNLSAAGGTSAPFPLAVTAPAALPVLTSAAPGLAVQGAGRIQLTLQGANFRPGATVVISPSLPALSDSNGHTQATDVAVLSVHLISASLMTAIVSLSPGATLGLRGIDVLNADGTTTAGSVIGAGAGGTTQPLQISSAASIAAPVSVLNIALLHPRDGTVVSLGGELYAEAVLSGAGTGSVIGQWLWDNRVVEQFAVNLVAGQSATVRTREPLPTWFLGGHTVQLRIEQPSQIATRPVNVVVTPAGWQLEALLAPAYGAVYPAAEPPAFLWAPVPGAVRYQVGFSTQPYFSSVANWFDSDENHWRVPASVWRQLPEGNLYWTVRAVDTDGAVGKPLPLRPIVRLAQGALAAIGAAPSPAATGHMLLDWNPANPGAFYLVTISSDAEGNRILRRYLTNKASLDLHAVENRLVPGQAYFCRVDVYSQWGDYLFSGPAQPFVEPRVPAAPSARLRQPAKGMHLQYVSLATTRRLGYFDLAAQISKEAPTPNSSVSQAQPAVSVQFASPVNPADVSLAMDDIDITSLAQVSETQAAYTPQLPLTNGEHDVSLTVGSEAAGWKFTIAAPSAPPPPATTPFAPGTDAEAAPAPTPSSALGAAIARVPPAATSAAPKKRFGGEIDMQLGSTSQWASGSNPPDSNVLTLADRAISTTNPWQPTVNGSGALNSILNPAAQRTSLGRVNDYIAQIERKSGNWGASLRFGIVSPVLYADAQFVTAATPRQGVEATATTPAGKLGFYTNTNDEALGGGAGITFHQRLIGASYQVRSPQWAEFRMMWLAARDIGAPTVVEYDSLGNPIIVPNPVAQKSRGDVYGGLLKLHLGKKWQSQSEYAWSYDNANLSDPASTSLFGRAWRAGISGSAGPAALSVAFRDLSPNFGNPANPSLTQASNPDLRGVDASASLPAKKAGSFALTYSFLQNNVQSTTAVELNLNTLNETWSKPFGPKTNLSIGSTQSLTETGTVPASLAGQPPSQNGSADQRDVSGNIALTRQVGMVSLTGSGTRDWLRNNLQPDAGAITSSISMGTNLVTKGFFQCNAQFNISWVAADPIAVGSTRNITLSVQPSLMLKRPSLQLAPVISVTQAQTHLASGTFTANTLNGQYGGRLAWTMPGWFKFSTLSAQGTYNQSRDDVNHTNTPTTQLVAIWTASLGHKKTF